jgi:hypothetical protein
MPRAAVSYVSGKLRLWKEVGRKKEGGSTSLRGSARQADCLEIFVGRLTIAAGVPKAKSIIMLLRSLTMFPKLSGARDILLDKNS